MRSASAGLVAVVLGAPFAATAATASEGGSWRFWGWVWAGFVTALAFGTTLWIQTRRRPSLARIGRGIVMATLTFLGLATTTWIAAWGFSPFTLEGLWIYPLALVPLGIVVFMFASRRRSKRDGYVWDRPPGTP